MAHDSQIARDKENLKLSLGVPRYIQASGTYPPIKALRQSFRYFWGLTHCPAIKEETIAINLECAYKQACRPSYNIQVISAIFIASGYLFDWNY